MRGWPAACTLPSPSPGQKELPQMERRQGTDWIGLRVTYKGKVTDIYINQLADGRLMHLNIEVVAALDGLASGMPQPFVVPRLMAAEVIDNIKYINQLADGRLMHLNSWIEADGWNTDAYMFAVSYPEGTSAADAKELFIGHGI